MSFEVANPQTIITWRPESKVASLTMTISSMRSLAEFQALRSFYFSSGPSATSTVDNASHEWRMDFTFSGSAFTVKVYRNDDRAVRITGGGMKITVLPEDYGRSLILNEHCSVRMLPSGRDARCVCSSGKWLSIPGDEVEIVCSVNYVISAEVRGVSNPMGRYW